MNGRCGICPGVSSRTTVHIEVYRVKCPDCGVKVEKVPLLPSKAPFSKRFEDAVGQACESAAARQVARRFGLAGEHRAGDRPALSGAMGGEPAKAGVGANGRGRNPSGKETEVHHRGQQSGQRRATLVWPGAEEGNAGRILPEELSARQRRGIEAACVDMWEPFRLSIEQWAPNCRIVYDKFHVMQHANQAIDEVRRAEFFRKGGRMRGLVKGKRWLLLSRWMNLSPGKRQELNQLFALNRKVFKAYLLKESLDRLWTYRYEGAMLNYLQRWIDQLRWQRLEPFRSWPRCCSITSTAF